MLGIVGGIAPASTIEYYRRIIDGYRAVTRKYPLLLLTSIDLDRVLQLVQADDRAEILSYLGNELAGLSAAPADMTLVHDRYMDELVDGRFREDTRSEFRAVMRRMRDDEGVEAVILGGTEIPLLLDQPSYDGLAMLDTAGIHIDAAVAALLEA